MTGDLTRDPPEWTQAGHITTKAQREAIKKRLVDPDDPLKMVIVCDMWLTGTDIPCLHTLYVDKPMKGHTIIQAISRVNRVFRDKPHGLVVDYIGIGEELREATSTYTSGGGRGEPAPSLTEQALPAFRDALAAVRAALPSGQDYGKWRQLTRIEYDDRCSLVLGYLVDDEERRDAFLGSERRLSEGFLLVKHLDEGRPFADELIFYQRMRAQVEKTMPGAKPSRDIEKAVRDLVDDTVETEGVVDIFKVAGIERADVSILDDKFLQTFKDQPLPNLRLKLLERLLRDEIESRRKRNLAQAKSFHELLEATLQRYHARLIDAAVVIKAMLEIKKDMEITDRRAAELGLTQDELAFYDAVAANREQVYDVAFLRDLVHDVVQTIKRNLKVGWTEPHRDDVKSELRAAVRRVLHRRGVRAEDFEPLLKSLMDQAEALFGGWPTAA